MFRSDLAGMPIVDDNASDYAHRVEDGVSSSGYIARPAGLALPLCAQSLPRDLYIDRAIRKEMIEEQERTKTRLLDLMTPHKIWLHQGSTNSCWSFAVAHAVMTALITSGRKPEGVNPTFIANIVTGYRDSGGWGDNALTAGAEYGWPSMAEMPELNVFGSQARVVVERVKPMATKRKATEWYFFGDDWDAKASMVLRRFGCYTGHSSIGHEIMTCAMALDANGNELMIDCDNYGDGYPQLVARTERFGPGEDQGCVRVIDYTE